MGSNEVGQLGFRTAEDEDDETNIEEQEKPEKIEGLAEVVRVAAGGLHNITLDVTGKVYAWGCNDDKCLGHSGDKEWKAEQCLGFGREEVIQVDGGDSHSAAVTSSGKCFSWGLYRDNEGAMRISEEDEFRKQPGEVVVSDGARFIRVACGSNHTVACTIDGKVYGWGCHSVGQVSLPPEAQRKGAVKKHLDKIIWKNPRKPQAEPSIVLVPLLMDLTSVVGRKKEDQKIVQVACGSNHSFALTQSGKVISWGLNNEGQLGLGDTESHESPGVIESLSGLGVCQIAGGDSHSMALTDSGSVYTWGEGLYGKLGHGEIYSPHSAKRQCSTPKKVDGMEGRGTRQISCGGQHCLAVTVRGKLFTWGQAGHFLGLGNEDDDAFSPSLVRGGGTKDKFIIHADGGGCHSILVAAPHIGSGALHI